MNQNKKTTIILKPSFFMTTYGLYNEIDLTSIKIDEIKIDFSYFSYDSASLFSISLTVSEKYDKITRKYQGIGEALAGSFSLIKVLTIFIRICLWYFNQIKIRLFLVRKLYDLEKGGEKKDKKYFLDKKQENKYKNFKKIRNYKPSAWEALVADIKNRFLKNKMTDSEKLYIETKNIYQRDIDLTYILRKIHEMEKLKLLLLNNKQLFVFNFLTKPAIYLKNFQEKVSPNKDLSESLQPFDLRCSDFETRLKRTIKNIQNSSQKIDKKLLKYLDKRFKNLKRDDDLITFKRFNLTYRRNTIP
jgi:hypothetical protein